MGTSIKEYPKEIKGGSLRPPGSFRREDWVTVGLILFAVFGGFALGRASMDQSSTVAIYGAYPAQNTLENASVGPKIDPGRGNQAQVVTTTDTTIHTPPATQGGGYVASKSGTKYHLPWCPGAQSMREENKIWFATKEDAERAGYKPASNCKGL